MDVGTGWIRAEFMLGQQEVVGGWEGGGLGGGELYK